MYKALEGHAITYDFETQVLYLDVILEASGLDFGVPVLIYSTIILNPSDYKRLSSVGETSNINLVLRAYENASDEKSYPKGTPTVVETLPITIVRSLSGNHIAITDPTGAWYAPKLDGTGFVLMQVAGGSVMYYYGYDKDGKRLWLVSEVINETWVKGEVKNFVMYEGQADTNTSFTTPPANAPGTVTWGKVEMRFDSCNKGYAKLDGVDGEQTFDLVKLAVPNAVHCMRSQ